jgi:MoxR-like ATPase
MSELTYTGDQANLSEPYVPDPDLKEAVNITIALRRPLLLKGEPGCGKTRLAQAVAEELGLPYYEWPVKSTSQAREGLYTYDTIGRLRDAQVAATKYISAEERALLNQKFGDPEAYISWGALGKAFRNREKRAVVLIDEIDKADIDFPNDLLHELDRKNFTVQEAVPPFAIAAAPANEPIIFITSNDEKELPAPFLRRCLFYYIDFPEKLLPQIVSLHVALEVNDALLQAAVNSFLDLRRQIESDKRHGGKNVSTSELLDWVKYMNHHPDRDQFPDRLTSELLFPYVLLKSREDLIAYK